MNTYRLSLVCFILLSIVSLSACEDKDTIILDTLQKNQMTVTGSATIQTPPDTAIAQIGVQTIGEEVDPVIAENNKKAEEIISSITSLGVDKKDIQTVSFNIYPLRDYNKDPNKIVGFQVDNIISVRFRNLNIIGKGLQAAISAGANNINSLNFTVDNPEPIRNEARTLAIQDARKKAESMAQAAGIELGKIVNVIELSSYSPIISRVDYDKAAAEAAVPVESGELSLTVQVQLVFELP